MRPKIRCLTAFIALFALLFSNLATASYWCCQTLSAQQTHFEALSNTEPPTESKSHCKTQQSAATDSTHTSVLWDQTKPSEPATEFSSSHQGNCSTCALQCTVALILPLVSLPMPYGQDFLFGLYSAAAPFYAPAPSFRPPIV